MKNKPECANNSYNHHKFISLLLMQSWLQNISKYLFILPLLFSLCGSSVGVTDSRWVSQERNSYPDCHSLTSLCVCLSYMCVWERESAGLCKIGWIGLHAAYFQEKHTYTHIHPGVFDLQGSSSHITWHTKTKVGFSPKSGTWVKLQNLCVFICVGTLHVCNIPREKAEVMI